MRKSAKCSNYFGRDCRSGIVEGSEEKSGKLAMVRREIAHLYCESGKHVIFHHHESV